MAVSQSLGSPPCAAGDQHAQIVVRNVSKSFGKTRALNDVTLSVSAGESRALLGRNGAGKSTLVGILAGMLRPDSGEISIAGRTVADAQSVSCVYQHSRLVPALTVAENIVMARYPKRAGAIAWDEVHRIAQDALTPWGLQHLIRKRVQDLAPVQIKVVEICRAISEKPQVLMLDEPTAGLDRQDAEHLFTFIDDLKKAKVTLIYVSHHLDEVYRFCDSATVLRDSRVVTTAPLCDLPKSSLIAAMMGDAQHAYTQSSRPSVPASAPVRLSIKGLTVAKTVKGFDLEVRQGECVGIAGIDGSGKAEIGAAIAGLLKPSAGLITVNGRTHRLGDVSAALDAGVGYVPENRHRQGMVLSLSVSENSTMTAMRRLSQPVVPGLLSVLRPSILRQVYSKLARQWNIVATGPDQLISDLSGGNQQKCVMARALATRPDVLVLQNPTAGVDVAAKASIMATLSQILAAGASIVIISEDADDFALASRIIVINHGRTGHQFDVDWIERDLVSAMQGGSI